MNQLECCEKWKQLKARGNITIHEIDSIDKETPWSEIAPQWWLEMMDERKALINAT